MHIKQSHIYALGGPPRLWNSGCVAMLQFLDRRNAIAIAQLHVDCCPGGWTHEQDLVGSVTALRAVPYRIWRTEFLFFKTFYSSTCAVTP